jgi:four helix bundle protein
LRKSNRGKWLASSHEVYALWNRDGAPRDFVLRDQMTRAASSIMHNIAEGFDSGSNPEFIRFLNYAKRSCTEVQSELYVGLDQRYFSKQVFDDLYESARRTRAKIGAFIHYLARNDRPESEPNDGGEKKTNRNSRKR